MSTARSDLDYKLRCLEKENDRLFKTIRHNRQNALALIAGVLLFVSAILVTAGEPNRKDLQKADYEEPIQKYIMGEPNSEARSRAVDRLSLVWDFATTVTGLGGLITIFATIFVIKRTGKFGPSKSTLEAIVKDDSETAEKYIALLFEEFEALEVLYDGSRRLLMFSYVSGLAMILGSFAVTFLWIWFGMEARGLP